MASAIETPPFAQAPAAPAVAPLPVGFRNPVALRVAVLMAVGFMLIEMLPVFNLLFFVWWLAAGWGAVLLYRRLTGSALSVRDGARLGSITGVLTFLSLTAIFALMMLVTGKEMFAEMVRKNPQISPVLNDPAMLAAVLLVVLCMFFAVVVGTCAAGGALGARFARGTGAKSSTVG